MAWRIALYLPNLAHAERISAAVLRAGGQVVPIADPALATPHATEGFDLLLYDPFHGFTAPEQAVTRARALAGVRPLLVLTPDDAVMMRMTALLHGADDAMAVGGDARELLARINALLRRYRLQDGILACDELEVDLFARSVSRGGVSIAMPLREFDLLARLARSRDRVVTRDDMLRAVWRLNFDPGTNRIEVHISRLRQRVDAGHAHAMLRTIKGSGYALVSRNGAQEMVRPAVISS